MIILVVAEMCLLTGFVTITTASTNILVESDHSYANNFDYIWPAITQPGATQMRLHFTELYLNRANDYLSLNDKNGNELVEYNWADNGKDLWTEWFTGDTIKVRLQTNGKGTAYGFKIDKVEIRTNSGFITVPSTDVTAVGNDTIPVANTAIKIGEGKDPAIYGKNVVWSNNGIHLYDLNISLDNQISLTGLYPAIYGNRIVWLDDIGGLFRLSIYDKSTGATSYITQNVDDSSKPAIYGDKIVWSANYFDGTYNSNVYLYDISTSEQTKIPNGCNPDIYGDRVAYMYYGQDSPEIHIYDITTQTDIKAISGGYPDNPHIYGNNVICSDFYTRLGFIILYDIATGKETAITNDSGYSGDPNNPDCGCDTGFHNEVFGNSVVYAKVTDDCFGKAGVYVYDISTAKSTMIFKAGNNTSTTPDIYDNIVIWGYDDLYNNGTEKLGGDIYVYKLSGSPTDSLSSSSMDIADLDNLSASFYANVTSGTAPLKVLFTSSTTGNPSSYFWVFEPSTSSDWNSKHAVTALHTFRNPGVYTVSLTVTNDNGSATVTRNNYITVS